MCNICNREVLTVISYQVERDQRKKDKEAAQKKAQTEAQLRRAREQQVSSSKYLIVCIE